MSDFVIELSQREAAADSNDAEHYVTAIECYLNILDDIKAVLVEEGDRDLSPVVSKLMDDLEEIYSRWTNIEAGIHNLYIAYSAVRVHCEGQRGRPQVTIDYDKLQFLREIGFPWTKIAELFSVSRRTLYTI